MIQLSSHLDPLAFLHSCDCTNFLLQECNKQGLLSEASFASLVSKRYVVSPSGGLPLARLVPSAFPFLFKV